MVANLEHKDYKLAGFREDIQKSMKQRFDVLDGWRGISILLVLAGHLLPLGPAALQMNHTIAGTGMVLFFILSGFLITNLLLRDQHIGHFLIRRFMRIIPLAWLALIITLFFAQANQHQWFSNLFFYANWPPMGLLEETSHFWSLCVEIQFYIAIALLVFALKDKAFWLLPILCITVTLNRVVNGAEMHINTYYRVDEILAGCLLALLYHYGSAQIKNNISRLNPFVLGVLLIGSAHPELPWLNYLRPYIALLLIGSTLFSQRDHWYDPLLKHQILVFIAGISYALYVIHGILMDTWLGQGDTTIEKYIKRPVLFVITFVAAYLSTKYYESYWIRLGKKLTSKPTVKQQA